MKLSPWVLALLCLSCGKNITSSGPVSVDPAPIAITTLCPAGYLDAMAPVQLSLSECAESSKRPDLSGKSPPLVFQVDCAKKILYIRNAERTLDTAWEMMPDGTFWVSFSGAPVLGKKMEAEFWGLAHCETARDTPLLQIEMNFTTAAPEACTYHAVTEIKQCG